MKHLLLPLLFCTVSVPLLVLGFESFLNDLPVDYVPYVCRDGALNHRSYNQSAVGHEFCDYGMLFDRNAFGEEFASNSYSWNNALCNGDADGDGRTNGEELGDANCTWTPCSATNTNCAKLTAVSHPGYYEDVESVNGVSEYVGDCWC